jgi:lipid A disaccharide synthetase
MLFYPNIYEDKHIFRCRVCGSPLIDAIQNPIVDSTKFRIENQLDDNIIALLPGSGSKK